MSRVAIEPMDGDPSDNKGGTNCGGPPAENLEPGVRIYLRQISQRAIEWEDHDKAEYFIGRIGPAKFEINGGVGGMFGAVFSLAGDCYAVLSTAKTVGEAKRFCEWVARSYGLDRITDQPTGLT